MTESGVGAFETNFLVNESGIWAFVYDIFVDKSGVELIIRDDSTLMTAFAVGDGWGFGIFIAEADLEMADVAGVVERNLVRDERFLFGIRIDDHGHRVEQLRFLAGTSVTIAARGDRSLFRVLGKEFGGQRRVAILRPDQGVRRNIHELSRRTRGVMALDAGDRAAGVVFAAIVFDVVKCDAAELRTLRERDHLGNYGLLFRRLGLGTLSE